MSYEIQIKRCDRCQRNAADKEFSDILHPVKVVEKVWYLVGIDLIDAHKETKNGNRYILTQTDYFSKYVEAVPIPNKSAEAVAHGLYNTYCRHGAPAHVISDQGKEFVNKVLTESMVKVVLYIDGSIIMNREHELLKYLHFTKYKQDT
jgi:hypothetical protein